MSCSSPLMVNISAKPLPGASLSWVYYGHGQGTLPLANQQSTGLLVPAHLRPKSRRYAAVASETRLRAQCGAVALFESSHGQHKQKVPAGARLGTFCLWAMRDLNPRPSGYEKASLAIILESP